jgi:hypothetical protein
VFAWASGNPRKTTSAEQTGIARLRHEALVPIGRILQEKAAAAPTGLFFG